MSSAEQLADQLAESAFAALCERHRGELQLHCYRMLGSFEDSEDLVQETFLRAWRKRASFGSRRASLGADGRSSFRAWLYRIATNACLDVLRSRPRRVLPPQVAAAIQHLPPRQRAVLILRDVLGWSAKDAASLLEASVASVTRASPCLHTPRGTWGGRRF